MAANIPLATYRLQFNASFGFRDAISVLDYLRDLGISHVYASPILASRQGSGHGYDIIDFSRINPELGGKEAFTDFQKALEERGMGLLLDIVPNHMAANSENRFWMDVLEYGPDSPFASYFDINWWPPSKRLENKILLPFLDRPFAEILDAGDLRLSCEDGKFLVRYGEQAFPIAPHSYAQILRYQENDLGGVAENRPAEDEWRGILAAADSIAADKSVGTQAAAERRTKFEAVHERLRHLIVTSPGIRAYLKTVLRVVNGTPGDSRSLWELERILSSQHYRLAFWQTLRDAINYRRFFSIADLVAVRVEDPAVFEATHQTYTHLGFSSANTGYRVDHIDGLRDPPGYLNRLRQLFLKMDSSGASYLVVEKILTREEPLPADWPVEGTTGYDYLNSANRLMVDESQAANIVEVYNRWTSSHANFDDVVYEKKKFVMRTLLGVEMRSLGRELAEHAAEDRYARELDTLALTQALIETTACLPVYRTYIQSLDVPEAAQESLTHAIRDARARAPALAQECFDFVSDVLLLIPRDHVRPEQREARLGFVAHWQQFTGSIMAKGLEDTALYVYFPLASLNEVGGDPRIQKADPLAFHQFIAARNEEWPYSMNATTTHDTKRSEDTRARIAVLSEMPGAWELKLTEWSRTNQKYLRRHNSRSIPDRNEEYFFYQTLIGAWPLAEDEWPSFTRRIQEYLLKASREAEVHTRWIRPNPAHESALRDFVADVLDREHNGEFFSSFERFQEKTALYGMLNGLGQTLLRIACPGVPDCYQGSELWDLRLVDPDNRGPIDFTKRAGLLNRVLESANSGCTQSIEELLINWRDARAKLHVLMTGLGARRQKPELFLEGDYRPLEITGNNKDRVIAFARIHESDWAIAVVVRCLASLDAPVLGDERRRFWEGTTLRLPEHSPADWLNLLARKDSASISSDRGGLSLGDVFAGFPVALLLPSADRRAS